MVIQQRASVPLLPNVSDVLPRMGEDPLYDIRSLTWLRPTAPDPQGGGSLRWQPYDGVLVLNPMATGPRPRGAVFDTLFAVRLCDPEVVYLAPLLGSNRDLREFLSLRVVQSHLVDVSQPDHQGAVRAPTRIGRRTSGGRKP